MTITGPHPTAILERPVVTLDLYRDIHKGIRDQLFSVTVLAGRCDPSRRADRAALATRVDSLTELLVAHADHEDGAIQPVLVEHLPELAERIAHDHETVEARLGALVGAARAVVDGGGTPRHDVHALYCELASFTASYLEHVEVEERVVMPALEAAVGVDAVAAIHGAILGAIPPDEMAATLAIMFPAMNVDDLTEMFEAMRASAPPEVVEGLLGLVAEVVSEPTRHGLSARLGLA